MSPYWPFRVPRWPLQGQRLRRARAAGSDQDVDDDRDREQRQVRDRDVEQLHRLAVGLAPDATEQAVRLEDEPGAQAGRGRRVEPADAVLRADRPEQQG